MTIADAAHIHGISERTIRRWITDGKLPARQIRGALHVPHGTIETLARQSRTGRHARSARPRHLRLDNRAG
jgi:excisionase family DNA binding protein